MTARGERVGAGRRGQAFGASFVFHDDLQLTGLTAAGEWPDQAPTVVRDDRAGLEAVWSGAEATRTREMRDQARILLSVDHDPQRGYRLEAPGVGAALISPDGCDVRCAPGPDAGDWESLLVGQVLPLAATVRGLEVFHAAGVVRNRRAYVLCAAPGVGKTSLALHLVLAGAELLSDDVVAVDDRLVAHAGLAVLHVREAELQRIGLGPMTGLSPIGTARGRTRFAVDRPGRAQPLGAVYLLERAEGGPAIESVLSPSPASLLGATFNLSVRTPVRLVHHLELCARVAELVPIFRVRILAGQTAAELALALTAHIDERESARV